MKTLNDFLAAEQNVHILSINELVTVKGGGTPPDDPDDPFKKKLLGFARGFFNLLYHFSF